MEQDTIIDFNGKQYRKETELVEQRFSMANTSCFKEIAVWREIRPDTDSKPCEKCEMMSKAVKLNKTILKLYDGEDGQDDYFELYKNMANKVIQSKDNTIRMLEDQLKEYKREAGDESN